MSKLRLQLPKLYAIVDAANFEDHKDRRRDLLEFARELAAAGVTLVQYRNKRGSTLEILSQARELKRVIGTRVQLIMNDRADLCLAAGFDGVHLGQDDFSAWGARQVLGEDKIIGFSTHNLEQAMAAEADVADYIAIGPIFATRSKTKPDPVVGLAGLKEVRKRVRKPLVAIGGISRSNCQQVIAAGADSVAVIAELVDTSGESPRMRAEELLSCLR